MMKHGRSRLFAVAALVGAAIFSSVLETSARPFGYGYGSGRQQQYYNGYGYGMPARQMQGDYGAALGVPQAPSYGSSGAADYISAVCAQGTYTWEPESMPLRVYIGDGSGTPGYKPMFQDYLRRGFDMWCAESNNKISWREVSSPSEANITVAWTNRVTERPEGTEAGRTSVLTRYNTATGKGIIYGAKMLFLTQLPGRLFRDEEVEKTCIHEAGHAMGLQGHSPYRGDIMYYAVSPNQVPELSERDKNTLTRLYVNAPSLDGLALRGRPSYDPSRR